jgi:hypothetical protein
MIHYSFRIRNPYSNRFEHAVTKHGVVTQNKAWEFNIYRTATVFSNSLELTMRRDHAGLRLEIGLLGYDVEFQIYDVRHWDYEENTYSTHTD